MDTSLKNTGPITIPDTPLPGMTAPAVIDNTSSDPITIGSTPLPQAVTASQTISDSLNTLSKRILKDYQFGTSGALSIGTYINGTSGDLRLTPDGLTARNSSGVTTFAIDGTTGAVTLAGEIIGGSIQIGSTAAHSFYVDTSGNMWLGATTFASAPFKVDNTGNLSVNGASIVGGTIETSSSGTRVLLSGADNALEIFSGSSKVIQVDGSLGIALFGTSPSLPFIFWANNTSLSTVYGVIGLDASGNFEFQSGASNNIILSPAAGTVSVQGDLSMNTHNVNNINSLNGNNGNLQMNSGHTDTTVTHNLDPESGNNYNCGGSARYWLAVNAHFFTKQGGFGVFDDGVEMRNGKILSDTEALLAMQPDAKNVTDYGKPWFDYSTLPKPVVALPRDSQGKLVPKNSQGQYIDSEGTVHTEGEDLGAMMSILIGAVRELTNRIKVLESPGKVH